MVERNNKAVRNIVILGAGFAGIRVAQDLSKKLSNPGYKIFLVDKSAVHLFRADLYEVATAYNKEITDACLSRLKDTVATPVNQLIDKEKVEFLNDEIVGIEPKKRSVELKKFGDLKYEFLVVALGSVTNDFGIPGLEKYSFPLKTVTDALRINCHLDLFFKELWERKSEAKVCITIGGGGATGVEVAAELAKSFNKLCKKYSFPREKVVVQLVEAGNSLSGFDELGTRIITQHLRKMKIEVFLNSKIVEAREKELLIQGVDGENKTLLTDVTIWTGGVKVSLVVASVGNAQKRGAIVVDKYLQAVGLEGVFAAGDCCLFEVDGKPLPMLAHIAYGEGRLIAANILAKINGGVLGEYHRDTSIYVIPIGGRYALMKLGDRFFMGTWVWFFRRLLVFKYHLSILPFLRAWKKWRHGAKVFAEND